MENANEGLRREFEIWKAEEHRSLEVWKTQVQSEATIYQNVNMQGQGAMKAAMLINGGAAVALLAFVGAAINKDIESCLLSSLCSSMLVYVVGTLLAAIATGTTYLAGLIDGDGNNKDKVSKWKFWHHWRFYNVASIVLVASSYLLFLVSSLSTYYSFIELI